MQERELLETTFSPTIGFETNIYEMCEITLSIFDTSGQELQRWFEDENELLISADLVVFFYSVNDWKEQQNLVKDYLKKLHDLLDLDINQKKVIAFCHKIDLITSQLEEFKNEITKFSRSQNIPTSFTTLENGGNFALMNSFYFIFEKFSIAIQSFKKLVLPLNTEFGLAPYFLMDKEFRIISSFAVESQFPLSFRHIIQLSKHIKTIMESELNIDPTFQAFWIKNKNQFLLFISFAQFHPEFSFLVAGAKSDTNFKQLLLELQKGNEI